MENLKCSKKAVFGLLGALIFIGTIFRTFNKKPKGYEILTLNKDSKGKPFANVKVLKM